MGSACISMAACRNDFYWDMLCDLHYMEFQTAKKLLVQMALQRNIWLSSYCRP